MGDSSCNEASIHTVDWVSTRKRANASFYADHITQPMWQCFHRLLAECRDGRVLEYGCGPGDTFDWLLASGATQIVGIDIAPDMIAEAKTRIHREGFEDRAKAHVMDAHALDFPDDSFDMVEGVSILHHLDIDTACSEISRVLAPGGIALFVEPMGMNPIINFYRRLTPHYRTEGERPLTHADFQTMRKYFTIEPRFFILTTLLSALPALRWLAKPLHLIDRVALALPGIQMMAWMVILRLKPRSIS